MLFRSAQFSTVTRDITLNVYNYNTSSIMSDTDMAELKFYLCYKLPATSGLFFTGRTAEPTISQTTFTKSGMADTIVGYKPYESTPENYVFKGMTTSTTRPSSVNYSISPSSNIYIWFQKLSSNKLMYDTVDKYFYFEDGYTLQTYVGSSMNSTLNNRFDPTSSTPAKTLSFYRGTTKTTVNIYQYTDGNYYGAVKPSKSQTIRLTNGSTLSASASSYYWFKYEPIRWRVSKYGVSSTSYPSGFTSANTTKTKVRRICT